ncbi:MAG: diaminopimelate decarboxylase [Actinomycetota bacterium]
MSVVPQRLLPDTSSVGGNGMLSVGGCDVERLATEHGTPLFVYDEVHLRNRAREAVEAFGADRVIYATKAFLCGAMARLAHDEGLMLDVATGGELYAVRHAGVPGERCVMHGNNKSLDELRFAIEEGVRHIVVDSFDEIDKLEHLHDEGQPTPRVQVRITPGVHVHTHEFVQTGQAAMHSAPSSGCRVRGQRILSASIATSVRMSSQRRISRRRARSWSTSSIR